MKGIVILRPCDACGLTHVPDKQANLACVVWQRTENMDHAARSNAWARLVREMQRINAHSYGYNH